MLQFKSEQLDNAILDLQHSNFCGVAYVETLSNALELQRPRVLLFLNGEITYGGLYLPDPRGLSQALGQHFNLQIMDAALQLASKKIKDQSSIRQHLDLYVRLELLSWQDIETFIRNQIVLTLEQILPCAGTIKLNTSVTADLSYGEDGHGFTWSQLNPDLVQRRRVWASLAPAIASANAVPHQIKSTQHTITDAWVQQHIQQWINGQRTLGEIAFQVHRDPLELAHSYLHFVQMGWLTFKPIQDRYTPVNQSLPIVHQRPAELPIILSVDDSPVAQTMIKRNLDDRYNLLFANNAMDALNLLNRKQVELLLLDVTMPGIDGLEFCRTIRNIHKLRSLPIIMLTAKDGVFNKLKGQMAGSTHYLTKPIDWGNLIEVLNKYVPATIMS